MYEPIRCSACGVDSGRTRTQNGSVGSNVPPNWGHAYLELCEGGIGVAVWCQPCSETIERHARALVDALGESVTKRGRPSLTALAALARAF